ncbi:hypothetical protein CHS0354_004841 [Potamilus streckersoni]|uniref:Uncharacterized protein n=1 Tax=Potamilus streckersoni TaxID=2493646 RepID=A0AAE0S9F0_9BIVA|nr:hypothetical protein CHS0354_004841 [Potamilus streckersoni]
MDASMINPSKECVGIGGKGICKYEYKAVDAEHIIGYRSGHSRCSRISSMEISTTNTVASYSPAAVSPRFWNFNTSSRAGIKEYTIRRSNRNVFQGKR